ncbi:hypothetical protein D1007_36054 [Hordeum vulgare]|nr:hypothetical protein D1007_36054 [Hordeum vulgare]
MEFSVHHVDTHMRKIGLTLVYTDDPVVVEDSINTMERLLVTDDKYKVVGFYHAYTSGRVGHDHKVVVARLFTMMDTTNEPKLLKTSGLACEKLVNIHDHYKVSGSKKDKDSHVDHVVVIIDSYYRDTKAKCEKNKHVWHRAWVKRLDEYHIQTATKEAYTCYEMFRRTVDMRKCLLPEDDEGSSHKQGNGDKRHRK